MSSYVESRPSQLPNENATFSHSSDTGNDEEKALPIPSSKAPGVKCTGPWTTKRIIARIARCFGIFICFSLVILVIDMPYLKPKSLESKTNDYGTYIVLAMILISGASIAAHSWDDHECGKCECPSHQAYREWQEAARRQDQRV
jgi:hypothetical protein